MVNKVETFASSVKEEVVLSIRDNSDKRALLASFIKINGHLCYSSGKEILQCHSEKANIAKFIYGCLRSLYGVNARFAYTRSAGFLKRINYLVIVEEEATDILNDLGLDFLDSSLPKNVLANESQAASFFAGAFLAAGSVNDPQSTSYHLEISLLDEEYAKALSKLLNKCAGGIFNSKVTKRRSQNVLYLKKGDDISNFLILIGAKEACLNFENVRIDRDFANQTNRLENFDSANMAKTLKSAEEELKCIEYFEKHQGIERFFNPKLTILCRLRKENPDASLQELADLLSEEISSKVSKSNVNHLFRFLKKAYEEEISHEKSR